MEATVKNAANPSSAAKPNVGSLLSGEKLLALYATMLRCRALEERAKHLSQQARVAFSRPGMKGQEATEVGCAVDLCAGDSIASAGRDLIFELIRGLPLGRASAQLAPRSADAEATGLSLTGSKKSRRPGLASSGPFDAAVKRALADRLAGQRGVVVAFSPGDSASLEPPRPGREQALALAETHSLPILFVERCVRNKGSVNSSERMQDGHLSSHSRRHGFPGIPVDGNDVVAVYRVAYESLERARRGGGPTLIACRTCPGEHHAKLGRAGRSRRHEASDPIEYMEEHLLRKGLFSAAWKKQVADEFARELDALFATVGAAQVADNAPKQQGRR